MKAITLYQPWASLIAIGVKKFETRSWPTSYHGPIAIHAGKKKPSDVLTGSDIDIIFAMGRAFGVPEKHIGVIMEYLDALPRGAIVATSEIVDCSKMWGGAKVGLTGAVCIDRTNQYWSPNWQTLTDEFLFGDWRPGRFAWELANVKELSEPIPAKGKQGLWEWAA